MHWRFKFGQVCMRLPCFQQV